MEGTSNSPSTESDDISSDAVEAFLALPAIYTVTEETSSGVHIRPAQENEELTNWTAVPLYSAIVSTPFWPIGSNREHSTEARVTIHSRINRGKHAGTGT
ncbi:hypothetical protein CDL15_Pgr023981 [Punica granatum]|uniref:Uncharacterized protein n=1 Tax=Punica granatum TaxID=22663 RepID=A0A218XUI4_PUNGR|nr:hypothetical protein CDL15_Pgr023981 [Punica granatum]